MSKEGSVAPKERVNIVYRPATGDASEEIELPLKLMVMGDFKSRQDETPLDQRMPVNIDKDNFNEILKAQNLSVDISVKNKIDGEPDEEMPVSLKFESLKDFEPEAIAKNTDKLRELIEIRDALKTLKAPMSNLPEFKQKIQALVKDDDAREKLLKELGINNSISILI